MDKFAVLLDFDGTIDERNVALTLLDRFAVDDWKKYISMSSQGVISFREAVEKEFECLPPDRDKLTDFVLKETRVRDGLNELVGYCEQRDFPIEIVSGGLDFYIQPIMEKHGLGHIVRNCGIADFDSGDRLRVSYNHGAPTCDFSGTCKCFHVQRFQDAGHKVVLVGDGTSDLCASKKVDYVFARKKLLQYCQENSLPHSPFETFHDVITGLDSLTSVSH